MGFHARASRRSPDDSLERPQRLVAPRRPVGGVRAPYLRHEAAVVAEASATFRIDGLEAATPAWGWPSARG